jgi:hypothetical protein
MATTPISHQFVPLHLSGNTTVEQNQMLMTCLDEAVQGACMKAIAQLDRQSAQAVLDSSKKVKLEVSDLVVQVIHRHTITDKFKDEEVASNRVYPPTYRVRPIEAQVSALRALFPVLGDCQEKLARKPLLEGAEAWFAIPRWQALAPTYGEAVQMLIEILAAKRKVSNRVVGKLDDKYLRQCERSKLAEKVLAEQQGSNDILVVPVQAGMLHRGCSTRRTRASLAGNEFGLGMFAIGCMLLTHTERLSSADTLMIDCGGDEYSVRGDYTFDRVPLFDYDIGGIEVSVFYDDRARNQWGTPTAFLYKMV